MHNHHPCKLNLRKVCIHLRINVLQSLISHVFNNTVLKFYYELLEFELLNNENILQGTE